MSEFHQFDYLGPEGGDITGWIMTICIVGLMDAFLWTITQNPVVIGITTVGGLIVSSVFSEN